MALVIYFIVVLFFVSNLLLNSQLGTVEIEKEEDLHRNKNSYFGFGVWISSSIEISIGLGKGKVVLSFACGPVKPALAQSVPSVAIVASQFARSYDISFSGLRAFKVVYNYFNTYLILVLKFQLAFGQPCLFVLV